MKLSQNRDQNKDLCRGWFTLSDRTSNGEEITGGDRLTSRTLTCGQGNRNMIAPVHQRLTPDAGAVLVNPCQYYQVIVSLSPRRTDSLIDHAVLRGANIVLT